MVRFDRITHHPGVMGGQACIRGLRVTVSTIIKQLAAGHDMVAILADYPYLEREDIWQVQGYAANLTRKN